MPSKSLRDLAAVQSNFKALDEAVAVKFAAMDKQISAMKGIIDAQHAMIVKLEDDCDTMLMRGKRIRA